MFTRVLIGVDGEQGGRDAVALARQLAAPDACFALAHVYGAGLMPGAGAALLLAAELEESEELLERERRAEVPGAQLITSANHSIGRGLQLVAEQQGFDLIVIGACRHGFVGRALLGNDAAAAVGGAPCAVAIAPSEYAEHPHRLLTLGVGYDGSPQSERALAAALELRARAPDSTIKAVTVLPLQSRPYGEERPAKWPEAAVQLSDDQVGRLRSLNGVEGAVVFGEPSAELATFGEHLDLLIVGAHGDRRTGRLLHRSIPNRLARSAPCPLLVLGASVALPAAPNGGASVSESIAEVAQCSTTS